MSLQLLQNELILQNYNILKIRQLCQNNPGIIASTSLRTKIWTLLLLESTYVDVKKLDDYVHEMDTMLSHLEESNCLEQHVLENDINRTRAELEEFRGSNTRKCVANILKAFCNKYSIQYKQGMNEVLAPFVYLCSSTISSHNLGLPFLLFETFVFKFLKRYFCLDDSSFLYKAFRLFHVLLMYHDPELAWHLYDNDFPPELYSPQWFLTLYARSLPMPQVLRLWDMMISINDPAFTFFIGLCLLKRLKSRLLLCEVNNLPEILQDLSFRGEEDIDKVVTDAIVLYHQTPRCFCRSIRLCCVGTVELTPKISYDLSSQCLSSNIDDIHDKNLALQAVRSCVIMQPLELVSSLIPLSNNSSESDHKEFELQQFVLIDVRSASDSESNGGGVIPKAIIMDPSFLEQPDALEVWIQHFDGTKGCNICIIDMPIGQATSSSLWRRLLYGEGDGFTDTSTSTVSYDNQRISRNSDKVMRDRESIYFENEEQVIQEDAIRPGMKLANALQRSGFPNICILEGGFPALVKQLMTSRGEVEPVVIHHNPITWDAFLKATGREMYMLSNILPKKTISTSNLTSTSIALSPKLDELDELTILSMAHNIATRLGHENMMKILEEKMTLLK